MIALKKINLKLVYPIRNLVLRKGKPIESCYFIDDEKESTKHFGVELENKIVGVVSLFEQKNNLFIEKKHYQIRGMAVLDEFQQKGFGKLLVNEVETYCKEINSDLIWFNAREKAVPFYKKLNYKVFGKPFEIKDIGLHYIMFKKLK